MVYAREIQKIANNMQERRCAGSGLSTRGPHSPSWRLPCAPSQQLPAPAQQLPASAQQSPASAQQSPASAHLPSASTPRLPASMPLLPTSMHPQPASMPISPASTQNQSKCRSSHAPLVEKSPLWRKSPSPRPRHRGLDRPRNRPIQSVYRLPPAAHREHPRSPRVPALPPRWRRCHAKLVPGGSRHREAVNYLL